MRYKTSAYNTETQQYLALLESIRSVIEDPSTEPTSDIIDRMVRIGQNASLRQNIDATITDHEAEVLARQSEIAKGILKSHRYIQAGRNFVAENVHKLKISSLCFLGFGCGEEIKTVASKPKDNPTLTRVSGLDMAYIEKSETLSKIQQNNVLKCKFEKL